MRIDIVMILLLIALIGLGYVVSDDLHLREELNAIRLETSDLKSQNSILSEVNGNQQDEILVLNDQLSTCQLEARGLQETIHTTQQTLKEREQQLVEITMENQTMLSENNRLQSDLVACAQNTKDSQQTALVSGEAWMDVPSTSNVMLANADPVLGWIGKGALSLIIVGQGIVLWIKIRRPAGIPSGYILVTNQERQVISNLRRNLPR